MLKTIYRYVFEEFFFSFFVAFLFFLFIFIVNVLLLRAEMILSKKVPLGDVLLLLLYYMPLNITYTIPFGTLVGSLMALGRLLSNNEILAFRASGISVSSLFIPILFLGIALTCVAFVFNDYFVPLGNLHLKGLIKKIMLSNPGVELDAYSVKKYQDANIITGKVTGNTIEDLVIIDRTANGDKRVIIADRASLLSNEQQRGVISLKLDNIVSHTTDAQERNTYDYITAEQMFYNLLLKDIDISIVSPGPTEKSTVDVVKEINMREAEQAKREAERQIQSGRWQLELAAEIKKARELLVISRSVSPDSISRLEYLVQNIKNEEQRETIDRDLQSYKLEFHKKFAISFACLVFIFFAFAIGLVIGKSGPFTSFGIGAVMTGAYWFMLLITVRFGTRLSLSPFLAMWLPNLFVLAIGGIFLSVFRLRR
jgi:lipopolysaccharide export system permease protein